MVVKAMQLRCKSNAIETQKQCNCP